MPPKSKAQARYFRAVASGDAEAPSGMSQGDAEEMVSGYPTKDLPERKTPAKKTVKRKKARPRPQPLPWMRKGQ